MMDLIVYGVLWGGGGKKASLLPQGSLRMGSVPPSIHALSLGCEAGDGWTTTCLGR